MKIDGHCHIFNNNCVPVAGMMASRFGIAVSRPALNLIGDIKKGTMHGSWKDYFGHISLNPAAILSALTDEQEKDNIRTIVKNPDDFIAFLMIGVQEIKEITEKLQEDSPGIDIWVPLMMNMDHGYPGSRSKIPFEVQRQIMTRLTLSARGRIMPFYAFDPRVENGLEMVKKAIETQGFIGVKLYPPLGYKPIGNRNKSVEDAMLGLYEYCCRDHAPPIPITAHCSWSAGVYSSEYVPGVPDIKNHYRDHADPAYWRTVLDQFPGLKLDLAHFGGLGEWEARAKGVAPDKNWVDAIVQLMDTYDNVYTDLSFHGLPATDLAARYKKVLLEKIDGVEHKVFLGSDWYMSRMQCTLSEYWQGFETLLEDLFDPMTGKNTKKFLFSDATAKYLPAFFARQGGDMINYIRDAFSEESADKSEINSPTNQEG